MTTQPAGINSACVNEQNSYDTPYSLYLVSTRANSSSFWIKAVCQMTYVSTKHFTDVALHCQTPGSFQYADRCSRAVIPCFHFHTFCFLVRIWLLNDPQWNHRWFVQGFRCGEIGKSSVAWSRDGGRGRQSSGLRTYFWLMFRPCWSHSSLSDFGEICVETKRLTQRWARFHFVCTFKTTFSLWNSSCNFLPDPVQPPSSTNTIFNICSYCLLSSRQVPTFYYPGVDRSAQFRPADKFRLAEWMFKRINPAVQLCVTCKRFRLLLKKNSAACYLHTQSLLSPTHFALSAWRHQKPAGPGQTIDSPAASKWWHGAAIYKWHWQAVITVNERAEESTVNLSSTSVNPSVVSAHDDLTSKKNKKKQKRMDILTAALSALFMQICAFVSELGRRWQKISCARINQCTILA